MGVTRSKPWTAACTVGDEADAAKCSSKHGPPLSVEGAYYAVGRIIDY